MSFLPPGILHRFPCLHKYINKGTIFFFFFFFYSWLFLLGQLFSKMSEDITAFITSYTLHAQCNMNLVRTVHTHAHAHTLISLSLTHTHTHTHTHTQHTCSHTHTHPSWHLNYTTIFFSPFFFSFEIENYITICFIYFFVCLLLIDICTCRRMLYGTRGAGGGGRGSALWHRHQAIIFLFFLVYPVDMPE